MKQFLVYVYYTFFSYNIKQKVPLILLEKHSFTECFLYIDLSDFRSLRQSVKVHEIPVSSP